MKNEINEEKINPFGMEAKEIKTDLNIWLPITEGDRIQGRVKEVLVGDFGNMYKIEQDDGTELWTPSHKVLQNRLKDIVVGDKIGIVYDGDEAPSIKGRNPTRMYRVFMLELRK
jgi:hypothetical protein